MFQIRRPVLFLAALGAAACSSGPDSGRSSARDLTLAAAPASDAVLGPVERTDLTHPPSATAAATAPAPRPKIARRTAVAAAPEVAAPAAPAPAAAELPSAPAPEPIVDVWTGAGRALEPGQAVGVVPVAMGGGTRMPQTDLVSERGIRWTGMPVHGDDRCIPGRGEMLPGYRARRH